MRRHFDEQLEELNAELVAMGSLCEKSIALAARMLLEDEIGLKRKWIQQKKPLTARSVK